LSAVRPARPSADRPPPKILAALFKSPTNPTPHRQFFSSFNKGVDGSFFWADGVGPFDPEAQQSFNDAM
jgi:hypothetical protein